MNPAGDLFNFRVNAGGFLLWSVIPLIVVRIGGPITSKMFEAALRRR